MRVVALAAVLVACGRADFDPQGDATTAPRFGKVTLPPGGHAFAVTAAPSGSLYALFLSNGAFRSDDDGATWTACAHAVATAIGFDPAGKVYVGTDAEVFASSDNCATWQATGLPD